MPLGKLLESREFLGKFGKLLEELVAHSNHLGEIGKVLILRSNPFESVSLFALGYHWLPLATIDLVGDNREFEV